MKPLISLITPTWQRHEFLTERCIPSVRAQTYENIEHIIVSDGPDPALADLLESNYSGKYNWRYSELPEHPYESMWGDQARRHGESIAKSDLLGQIDDDDSLRPNHVELLMNALEKSGADFAYSSMRRYSAWDTTDVVGTDPPTYGQIGVCLLYKRKLLDIGSWRYGFNNIDWDLVERWINGGATWVFVPQITVDGYPSAWR